MSDIEIGSVWHGLGLRVEVTCINMLIDRRIEITFRDLDEFNSTRVFRDYFLNNFKFSQSEKDGSVKPFASIDLAPSDDKTVICDFYSIADDKQVALDGLIASAKNIRNELQAYNDSNERGEIYFSDRMSDPIDELIRVLDYYEGLINDR